MNSQILKLAKKSGATLNEGFDGNKAFVYGITMSPEELEKFAELIVRECLRQVQDQYKPVLEDEIMMKETHWVGYVHCGVDSYVAIREHFGVEP